MSHVKMWTYAAYSPVRLINVKQKHLFPLTFCEWAFYIYQTEVHSIVWKIQYIDILFNLVLFWLVLNFKGLKVKML